MHALDGAPEFEWSKARIVEAGQGCGGGCATTHMQTQHGVTMAMQPVADARHACITGQAHSLMHGSEPHMFKR